MVSRLQLHGVFFFSEHFVIMQMTNIIVSRWTIYNIDWSMVPNIICELEINGNNKRTGFVLYDQ